MQSSFLLVHAQGCPNYIDWHLADGCVASSLFRNSAPAVNVITDMNSIKVQNGSVSCKLFTFHTSSFGQCPDTKFFFRQKATMLQKFTSKFLQNLGFWNLLQWLHKWSFSCQKLRFALTHSSNWLLSINTAFLLLQRFEAKMVRLKIFHFWPKIRNSNDSWSSFKTSIS